MKEIPILFSTPMVQAILDGRKTMTRRIVKADHVLPIPNSETNQVIVQKWKRKIWYEDSYETGEKIRHDTDLFDVDCPYGKPGDVLWVRETFRQYHQNNDFDDLLTDYYADGGHQSLPMSDGDGFQLYNKDGSEKCIPWKPGIHMPKSACRIWLEVVSVKVERLHSITNADIRKEGLSVAGAGMKEFKELWQSINGSDSWQANPWVWVIEFKRIEK